MRHTGIAANVQVGMPGGLAGWHQGLSDWHPWLAEMIGSHKLNARSTAELMQETPDIYGNPVRIEELTGKPGEAVLCHPAMLHAVSANVADVSRIMRRTSFRRNRTFFPPRLIRGFGGGGK